MKSEITSFLVIDILFRNKCSGFSEKRFWPSTKQKFELKNPSSQNSGVKMAVMTDDIRLSDSLVINKYNKKVSSFNCVVHTTPIHLSNRRDFSVVGSKMAFVRFS